VVPIDHACGHCKRVRWQERGPSTIRTALPLSCDASPMWFYCPTMLRSAGSSRSPRPSRTACPRQPNSLCTASPILKSGWRLSIHAGAAPDHDVAKFQGIGIFTVPTAHLLAHVGVDRQVRARQNLGISRARHRRLDDAEAARIGHTVRRTHVDDLAMCRQGGTFSNRLIYAPASKQDNRKLQDRGAPAHD
jgi:hypothetical protein